MGLERPIYMLGHFYCESWTHLPYPDCGVWKFVWAVSNVNTQNHAGGYTEKEDQRMGGVSAAVSVRDKCDTHYP